ncbi:hypothetical protein [Rhizorhabdus sp. FW153]|uniref:hypothetical protein n=1 Tax=Rhizorhabdus sp. FW153 TaxID=3400216 RepID=UPI003CF1A522
MEEDVDRGITVRPAWQVLYRRWNRPKAQMSFWTFLAVGIVLLGGLAVWIEFYRYAFIPPAPKSLPDLHPLQLALATAGLAIGGPAAMQMLYSRDKLCIVTAIILFTIVMIFAMYLMVFGEAHQTGTLVGGLICCIPAILAWVLANGEDDIFQDEVRDDASTGGNPMRPLGSPTTAVKV